jgi:general secretion pathway protein G
VYRSAFSLIELLLVMVILVVLAAVVVPKFTGRSEQAREAAAKADISRLGLQLDAFEIDTGRFPNNSEGLAALVTSPGNVQNWRGPYIQGGIPKDPWGNLYQYQYPGTNNPSGYDLFSMGPDGRVGNDDISNWEK